MPRNRHRYGGLLRSMRSSSQEDGPQPVEHAPTADTGGRDLRLDLFRGLALWFIYLNHIPGNSFDWLTSRHYGFSDTTEIFFFVSGYTCAIAYGEALEKHGARVAIARILRRAIEIYVGFVLLVVVYLSAVYAVAGMDKAALDSTNTATFFAEPGAALMHVLMLRWMPVNTDVLATFALLHALFVPLLFLMRRAPDLALSLSVALYALVQVFSFNIPTWPKGEWFFNPFAWQVLVVFGAWIAFGGARKIGGFVASRAVLAGVVAYVVASLIIALGWKFEPLRVVVPQVIADMIYPVDKSSLSPLRLAHFLALAIIAMRFMPQNWPGLSTPPLNFLVRSGQNSLAIYAIGVVLSFIASQVLQALGGGLGVQAFVSLTGIAAIAVLADILTRLGKLSGHRPKLF